MITVIPDYVKGSLFAGILCYAASALVPAVFFGLQFYAFAVFRSSENRKWSLLHNALLMACLWVLFEWTRSELFSALPWLSFSAGITVSRSLYLVQLAAIGGPWMLSFMILLVAFFTGHAFRAKKWKLLIVPLALVLLQFACGAVLYTVTSGRTTGNKPGFTAALVQPALSPETVWDDEHAGELVNHLFSLNAEAMRGKPDLVVWTETVVPWTYAPDDDFLEEIQKMTRPVGTYTLIGMNSTPDDRSEVLLNSVHLLDPAGNRTAFYDKQDLLTLVEKPLFTEDGDLILPFLATSGMNMRSGSHSAPVTTPWGKAGVLLCNESTSPSQAMKRAELHATFLVNIGNDNWFADSYIALQHFYNCRLRAVETRKDVLINNNMGFSGLVRADGIIAAQHDATVSGVKSVVVRPNSLPACNPSIFIFSNSIITLFLVARTMRFRQKRSYKQQTN
jgi:apolipoprotein N-acyltransferase